ncbi:MAG: glycerophosphodiester phosphodiesterase family protein, partial [Clostridia bacterium]|nr:glycerophosphodiester phosphodiesterase family protein [Clostridia bacterium]
MQTIYAHRGASGYAPENTLRALDLAADMHADGVEIDVQRTKDGKLVVFHDETLDRVTDGVGPLCMYTYDELRRFPLVHAAGGSNADVIPLLSDVLALLSRRSLKLNIELKNSRTPYPGMEEEVIGMVEAAGMREQ